MHHFVKESRIAAAPGVVFAFHESPGALEKLTPPWEKVTVIESPGSLAPGTRAGDLVQSSSRRLNFP